MIDAQHNHGGGRGQILEGRWSRRELARLHGAADPEIDQVVAAYHRQHPELTDPRDLVRSMKLPRSVVRWLFRDAPGAVSGVPDMLRVPPTAWWSGPLQASLRDANADSRLLGPLQPVAHARRWARHAARAGVRRLRERGTRRRRS